MWIYMWLSPLLHLIVLLIYRLDPFLLSCADSYLFAFPCTYTHSPATVCTSPIAHACVCPSFTHYRCLLVDCSYSSIVLPNLASPYCYPCQFTNLSACLLVSLLIYAYACKLASHCCPWSSIPPICIHSLLLPMSMLLWSHISDWSLYCLHDHVQSAAYTSVHAHLHINWSLVKFCQQCMQSSTLHDLTYATCVFSWMLSPC